MRLGYRRGFTLVELVVTMIIISILAAVALPRLIGRQGFEARGYFDAVAAAVRYAQKAAIAQRRNVFVQWTATTVTLCYSAAIPCTDTSGPPPIVNNLINPVTGVAPFVVDAQRGTSATAPVNVAPTNVVFGFNSLGQPLDNTGAVAGGAQVYTFTPSEAGDVTRTLTIERDTGYVHW